MAASSIDTDPLRPDDLAMVPVAGGVFESVSGALFKMVKSFRLIIFIEASLWDEIFFVANCI